MKSKSSWQKLPLTSLRSHHLAISSNALPPPHSSLSPVTKTYRVVKETRTTQERDGWCTTPLTLRTTPSSSRMKKEELKQLTTSNTPRWEQRFSTWVLARKVPLHMHAPFTLVPSQNPISTDLGLKM